MSSAWSRYQCCRVLNKLIDEQTARQLVNQSLVKGLILSKDDGDGRFIDLMSKISYHRQSRMIVEVMR